MQFKFCDMVHVCVLCVLKRNCSSKRCAQTHACAVTFSIRYMVSAVNSSQLYFTLVSFVVISQLQIMLLKYYNILRTYASMKLKFLAILFWRDVQLLLASTPSHMGYIIGPRCDFLCDVPFFTVPTPLINPAIYTIQGYNAAILRKKHY